MRILLVEDNVGDERLLQEYLAESTGTTFHVEGRLNLADALRALERDTYDLILLDLFLPDSTGLATFTRVHQAVPHLPIIVMSGLDDEAQAIRTVHEGAQDYLVKGQFDSRLLARAIRYAVERKQAQETLTKERDLLRTLLDNLKKIEDELAAERNLLRSLIDNLPDYIYIKDIQGRYLLDNIAHRHFLGMAREEDVIGRRAADFFPPEVAARVARDDEVLFATGEALINREEQMRARQGAQRWHVTTRVPLRGPDQAITGLVGIGRDITEKKLAEERLRQANAELARSKEELMKVLADLRQSHEDLKAAQFQLIQAEKMQSIGRLAAGVAHEVKNPLAILGMGIEYLAQHVQTEDQNAGLVLKDMGEALHRADSIIHGLLDFAVPHALHLSPVNLSELLEQSLALVRHELSATSPRVVKELAPTLPLCRLDPNKIKQACVNLLSNAIHAMPEGGTLTLRTSSRQLVPDEVDRDVGARHAARFRSGDTVVIAEILDTGTGIPEDKLAKIYDPFFTTKPTGQGTGLGLTVTKKIIELHGGTLEISNRKEGGVQAMIMFKL